MAKQVYRQVWGARGPYAATRRLIHRSDEILNSYEFPLTLRQLFYRLVAENTLENTKKAYDKLSNVMTDARYAGLIDWDHIIDRTRSVADWRYHKDEAAAVDHVARNFLLNKWEKQPARVEIWVEKDAAIGTIEAVATELRVPYGSTRGYHSTSGAYEGAKRILPLIAQPHQRLLALHIADHDPSGVDMTRDLEERLQTILDIDAATGLRAEDPSLSMEEALYEGRELIRGRFEIRRIALNRDQVANLGLEQISQPVKSKDPRAGDYVRRFGNRCWELDAMEPDVLAG